MTNTLPILIAAGWNELVSILVGLVFLVIWVINQINDAKKKQAAEAQPRAEMPPQPDMPGEPAQAPPADPLRAQVDEFLRRASQQPKPAQPAPPRQPAGREEIVVLLDEKTAEPPRKALAETMRSLGDAGGAQRGRSTKPAPPPRERRPSPPRRAAGKQRSQSVAEHVAERIGAATQEFQKEVADLGSRVKQADEQFDVQLEQKFGHHLGSLGDRQASGTIDPTRAATNTPAAQIAALLASPDGVRQAIVLNEILNRPVDRW